MAWVGGHSHNKITIQENFILQLPFSSLESWKNYVTPKLISRHLDNEVGRKLNSEDISLFSCTAPIHD